MQLRNWVCAGGICLGAIIATGCSDAGHGNTAGAETPAEPPADAIGELTATLEEMGVRSSPESLPEPAISVSPDVVVLGDPPPGYDGISTDVGSEIALLREHVYELDRSLTFYMDTVVTDLREENAYLRDELARVYATIPFEDRMRPVVPRPGSAVLNDVQDVAADPNYAVRADSTRSAPPVPLEITVAKEWGRTPDEAAEMGGGVKSLRGMIGSVPLGASDDALLRFAGELREQYAEYANINIVVFDSEAAATAYATRNAKSTPRHILTITRHAKTGVDEIYLHRNGVVVHTERF